MILPVELAAQIEQVIAEQRQRKNLPERGFAPTGRARHQN